MNEPTKKRPLLGLNLGCGNKPVEFCLNVDCRKTDITDLVFDANVVPYPFEDGRFDFIYALDIIEHLNDVMPVMEELHRILAPGGHINIRTTAWDREQSFRDPTHKHWFTLNSFDVFDPTKQFGRDYHWYTTKKFRVLKAERSGEELEFMLYKARRGEEISPDEMTAQFGSRG